MKKTVKKVLLIILIPLLILGAFLFGFIKGSEWGWKANLPSPFEKIINKEPPKELPAGDMSLFWDTWQVILDKYVERDKLNTKEMIEGAASGLVQSLKDPYSEFFNASSSQYLAEELSGEFCGVGMEIDKRDGFLIVLTPLPNTPASKAGLMPFDKILQINDQDTSNLTPSEAAQLIRGPEGTEVKLLIYRPSWDRAKVFDIKREKIVVPSLKWQMINNDIGYLRIYNFNQPLFNTFYQTALKISFNKPKGLIIDLRNNPGGYLEAVIDVGGWFLNKGEILLKEDLGNGEVKLHRSPGPGSLGDLKMVVLINEGTASASEILAGALRDNLNTKLVGTKSYGKGSVQELVALKDGNMVKITISRWLTPNGTQIENNGLKPDIEVKNEEELGSYLDLDLTKDAQLQKAMEILNEELK
ncbi:MAG TPA: S41 family peptidase [Candidatus Paceibacterota bacterium]|nr:S41 family peptidase [Candidatus Paceibacterota bacterium]HPP64610.1 S41 family peptidase [Candidatus Paceibacterota bacterium]